MTETFQSPQDKIDAHLDAVETALQRAGISRERRRAIVADLESQIGEMLSNTARPLTLTGVDAVLSQLDPPESFARSRASVDVLPRELPAQPSTSPKTSRFHRSAALALWLTMLGYFGLGFIVPALTVAPQRVVQVAPNTTISQPLPTQSSNSSAMLIFFGIVMLGGVMTLVGCALGWSALADIGRSAGELHGGAAAGFAAMLLPTTIILLLSMQMWSLIEVAYYDSAPLPERGQAIMYVAGPLTALIPIGLLVWLAIRLAHGSQAAAAARPVLI